VHNYGELRTPEPTDQCPFKNICRCLDFSSLLVLGTVFVMIYCVLPVEVIRTDAIMRCTMPFAKSHAVSCTCILLFIMIYMQLSLEKDFFFSLGQLVALVLIVNYIRNIERVKNRKSNLGRTTRLLGGTALKQLADKYVTGIVLSGMEK
jgi:hypothetical protein